MACVALVCGTGALLCGFGGSAVPPKGVVMTLKGCAVGVLSVGSITIRAAVIVVVIDCESVFMQRSFAMEGSGPDEIL